MTFEPNKPFVVVVVSDSKLTLCYSMGLQHARFLCSLLSPGVCTNSCPLCRWWHPTISSSVALFSSFLQSFPISGFFPMSQLFPSGSQNTYLSFSFSISPSNEYSGLIYFRIDWFDLLAVQGTLKSFLKHHKFESIVVKILCSQCSWHRFNPWSGKEDPACLKERPKKKKNLFVFYFTCLCINFLPPNSSSTNSLLNETH